MSKIVQALRIPKVQVLLLLATLVGVALVRRPDAGPATLLVQVLVGVATAVLAEWAFFGPVDPNGVLSAAVTGMLTGMLPAPGVSLRLVWLAGVAAIAAKRLLRSPAGKHFFNPAALGLVLCSLVFGNQLNWWGSASTLVVLAGFGWVLLRMGRLALPFAYILGRTGSVFALNGSAGIAGALLSANLLFAFVMLPEPKTSPGGPRQQWVFGAACGILSTGCAAVLPAVDPDLTALLTLNLTRFVKGIR